MDSSPCMEACCHLGSGSLNHCIWVWVKPHIGPESTQIFWALTFDPVPRGWSHSECQMIPRNFWHRPFSPLHSNGHKLLVSNPTYFRQTLGMVPQWMIEVDRLTGPPSPEHVVNCCNLKSNYKSNRWPLPRVKWYRYPKVGRFARRVEWGHWMRRHHHHRLRLRPPEFFRCGVRRKGLGWDVSFFLVKIPKTIQSAACDRLNDPSFG